VGSCYPLLTFNRRQHVENTFRIFDVFERVMMGKESGEVTVTGMGLTYFPREMLQCTLLKVRGGEGGGGWWLVVVMVVLLRVTRLGFDVDNNMTAPP